jgi:hypothetical protein
MVGEAKNSWAIANWEVRMSKTSLVVTILAVVALAFPAHAQVAPAAIDYDTFMQQDVQGRLRVFNQVTPENRAELVRTQIIRWVEGNRARLTPEQLKVMDENLAYVTPDRYRQPMNQEQKAQAKEMEARTAAVLSREEMMQALTVYATYIPKKQ